MSKRNVIGGIVRTYSDDLLEQTAKVVYLQSQVERLTEALVTISQLDPMSRSVRAADQAIGIAEAALAHPAAKEPA